MKTLRLKLTKTKWDWFAGFIGMVLGALVVMQTLETVNGMVNAGEHPWSITRTIQEGCGKCYPH